MLIILISIDLKNDNSYKTITYTKLIILLDKAKLIFNLSINVVVGINILLPESI